MNFTLFKRQLAITVVVTLVFIFLGLFSVHLFMQFERQRLERERMAMRPPQFIANLVDQLVASNRFTVGQAVEEISKANRDIGPMRVSLIDRVTYAKEKGLRLEDLPTPEEGMRDDPNDPAGGGPPRNGPPNGPPPDSVVALKSAPQFLLRVVHQRPPGGKGGPPSFARFFTLNFVALFVAVLLASTSSLFLLFYSMRKKASLASSVIADIKRGNLEARFPVTKVDEASQLMVEFNKMADEIESLVRSIKASEQGRMALLQQLAHDLRTPVASLKNLLETLRERGDQINSETRGELMELSLKEVEYFERLVEDLLFLAQVSEPQFNARPSQVDLGELLNEELDRIDGRHSASGQALGVDRDISSTPLPLNADPHLLRRLIRNALENAASFARSEVSVSVRQNEAAIEILVKDDGPGLSQEALAAFGEKRFSRVLNRDAQGRLSVGLGSVIMKAVAHMYGGKVSIRNTVSESNQVTGAELSIVLTRI